MRLYVVCLYVCPSVTSRYVFHTGWNTSKIISRPNSLSSLLILSPTWAIWCNGNTLKIGVEKGWGQEHIQAGISPKWCKTGPRSLLRTNVGSCTRAFDLCQIQWPWMTLNGWNVTLAEINKIYGAHQKNFERRQRSILLATKCRRMIEQNWNSLYI